LLNSPPDAGYAPVTYQTVMAIFGTTSVAVGEFLKCFIGPYGNSTTVLFLMDMKSIIFVRIGAAATLTT